MTRREFPIQPLVGVGAVIVDDKGRVLLIQRGTEPMKGHWSLPGGLVELGETLVTSLKREIAEETGLFVEPQAVVEVVERIYTSEERIESGEQQSQVRYHYVVIDYWCRVLDGELRPSSDAADVAWVYRDAWKDSNPYALDTAALRVIEKGWHMAQEAGKCSNDCFPGG